MGLSLYLKLCIYQIYVFKCRSLTWLQETYYTEKQSKNKSSFSCADVGDNPPPPAL